MHDAWCERGSPPFHFSPHSHVVNKKGKGALHNSVWGQSFPRLSVNNANSRSNPDFHEANRSLASNIMLIKQPSQQQHTRNIFALNYFITNKQFNKI
jgi:hypothetical protein